MGASLVVQMVKNLPAMQETQLRSLCWEDPLEKEMATTPVLLPGESHGQKSLLGYSPWGCKESDKTERLTHSQLMRHPHIKLFHTSALLQMPNNHSIVDVELFRNICSCKGSSFMIVPVGRCQRPMPGHYAAHVQGSHLLCKTSWPTTAWYIR